MKAGTNRVMLKCPRTLSELNSGTYERESGIIISTKSLQEFKRTDGEAKQMYIEYLQLSTHALNALKRGVKNEFEFAGYARTKMSEEVILAWQCAEKVNKGEANPISDWRYFLGNSGSNEGMENAGHKPQHGTVIHVGDLWYEKGEYGTLKWEINNELQEGDLIVYYYNADSWGNGNYWIDGQDVYFFIRYDSVYFAIRGDEIIPVNGYNLVEPIDEFAWRNSKLELPEKKSKKYGYVRHVGTPLGEVSFDSVEKRVIDSVPVLNNLKFVMRDLKKDDFVQYQSWAAKPIMYETQNFVGDFYAMQRFGMTCVHEDPSRVTI